MKKVLVISTISGFLPQFEMNNVSILQKLNYEVHYASNFKTPVYGDNSSINNTGIIKHQIDFIRSPFNIYKNSIAYLQLKRLMIKEKFNLIHCHTPMGATLGRLAAKACGIKFVIYTAHGLHFYKGSPLINWVLYYPIERILSLYTDVIITINNEDFNIVKKFKTCKVLKIDGVGLDIDEINNVKVDKEEKCRQLNIDCNKFILCSVGEVNKNKNHLIVLKALRRLKDDNIIYIVCGNGNRLDKLQKKTIKYNLQNNVIYLGHRRDIAEILSITDCFIFPSKREGLGMAALEAMATGLPLLISDTRGSREYAINGKTGFVYNYNDYDGFAEGIERLKKDSDLRNEMGKYNRNVVKKFDVKQISIIMEKLYSTY